MVRFVLAWIAIAGCSSSGSRPTPNVDPATAPSTVARTEAAKPACADPVLVLDDGQEKGLRCLEALPTGSTILDLRDQWTPRLFVPTPDGTTPAFRATYLALAAERDLDGSTLPQTTALAELYGIVPSLAIVRRRLAEQDRYACHRAIPSAPLGKLTRPYGGEHAGLVRNAAYQRKLLGAQLERVRAQRQLPDLAPLESDRELGPIYVRWRAANDIYEGVATAQRHLACAGTLADKAVDGTFSWATGMGLELYQRRNFLIPNSRLDPETRAALGGDPEELDFRFALRVLRERVVDATGVLEDGTAGAGPQPILGRMLDPESMRGPRGHGRALANAAPDLVSAFTEAAARELGWTTPETTRQFLTRHPEGVRVAVTLPARPAYHSAHMELSAEIDRGDVWYDEAPTARVAWRRPALVLFVDDAGTKRPLIRWPTTIGGWSDVRVGGGIVKRWKESDVGPRQWRELYAAPTWLPPSTTPDHELVRWVSAGKWELKRSIMGPGPHAAFGMMLLPHYQAIRGVDGRTRFASNGIGTHGSAVVTSILNGTSHGCHRLYNQLAVRLGSFLLAHRTHAVKGQQKEHYRRTVRAMGTYQVKIDTRGFLYELTPPIPVEVLPGTVRSARKVPPLGAAPAGAI